MTPTEEIKAADATEDKNQEVLKSILPEGNEIKIESSGEILVIKPLRFGQLPKVLKHLSALFQFTDAQGNMQLKRALLEGGEDILQLLAIAAAKPRAWFDDISLDEGVAILAIVITQNQDFFVRTVIPMIRELTSRVEATTASMKVTGLTT